MKVTLLLSKEPKEVTNKELRVHSRNIFSVRENFSYFDTVTAQCGNYGISLSLIVGKNFVKVTVLLKKSQNSLLVKKFSVRVNS